MINGRPVDTRECQNPARSTDFNFIAIGIANDANVVAVESDIDVP